MASRFPIGGVWVGKHVAGVGDRLGGMIAAHLAPRSPHAAYAEAAAAGCLVETIEMLRGEPPPLAAPGPSVLLAIFVRGLRDTKGHALWPQTSGRCPYF